MHLLTSSATFTLVSPLKQTTVVVTHLNVTAFYNHTEPAGVIIYDLPIVVHPGSSQTPRLPVDWSLNGIGYSAVKDALGGSLKLDSYAQIGFQVGNFRDSIWFEGKGLGARVRL